MLTITVEGIPALQTKVQNFSKLPLQQHMLTACEVILSEARARAPKRSGALVASIASKPGDTSNTIMLFSSLTYSAFIEFGTKPHVITVNGASVLHWVGKDGHDYFAMYVHNPGIAPGKFAFMRPAITSQWDNFVAQLLTLLLQGWQT